MAKRDGKKGEFFIMALKIRLRQQGCNNRQTYRIVVADEKVRRDGRYVEKLGWYLPYLTEKNCSLDADRMLYWLQQGAQMSDQVRALAKGVAPQVLKHFNEQKQALRARRIAQRRVKKKEKKAAASKS
jgi:small subunit ribosomal protein S16